MIEFIFDDTKSGKLARSRLAGVEANFRWFCAEWIGEGEGAALKFTGGIFREAMKGKNKGKLSILVPGTNRVAVISRAEARDCKEKAI